MKADGFADDGFTLQVRRGQQVVFYLFMGFVAAGAVLALILGNVVASLWLAILAGALGFIGWAISFDIRALEARVNQANQSRDDDSVTDESGLCLLYRRGRVVIAQSLNQAEAGFWLPRGPCEADEDPTPERVAEMAITALDASIIGVPTPPPGDKFPSPLPELAGVKTYSAFMKGTLGVKVARDPGSTPTYVVHALKNVGPRRGFEFGEKQTLTDPTELPAAIASAFEQAS